MGVRVYNFSLLCDYATPEKHTALQLHMELPIPHADLAKIQAWLSEGEWDAAGDYLAGKYPRHRSLLDGWLGASRNRSEGASPVVRLAAAS